MKSTVLVLLLTCCAGMAMGQQQNLDRQRLDFMNQVLKAAAKHPGGLRQMNNRQPEGVRLPANIFPQAILPLRPQLKKPVKNSNTIKSSRTTPGNTRVAAICKDTSYRRLTGIYNSVVFVQSVTQTNDGGLLVSATITDSTRPQNLIQKQYGLLVKLDETGTVVWLRQFENLQDGPILSFYYGDRAYELSNGDIIATGLMSIDANLDVYATAVWRLTSTGNEIWATEFKNNIGIFNSGPGSFTFYSESATEGLNGDIILCGTSNSALSSGKIATVLRINNQGQVVWDANYGNHGVDGSYRFGMEGLHAFAQSGQITMMGLSHGTNYPQVPPAACFFTLDYATGNLLNKRFFRPGYADPNEEAQKGLSFWGNRFLRLSNGHFLLYGKMLSDYGNYTPDHFGVMEFDASLNVVDAYTIRSGMTTNYYNDFIYFDESGKGLACLFQLVDGYNGYAGNIYFGAFSNHQFQKQRKAEYRNVGMPGNNGFAWLKDNGYAYIQTHFEVLSAGKSYFEFVKMHNSDTASLCLGKDTTLMSFLPLHIIEDPAYWLWDDNDPNHTQSVQWPLRLSDATVSTLIKPCKQVNSCDTIKIHGNTVICGNMPSLTFTSYKNADCGAIVQWGIAKEAIDSFHVLNDTTVTIWFKNVNWQGKLYATLPAGACSLPSQDSLLITVARQPMSVNLGADTVLCPAASLSLRAGTMFTSYVWNDGSTDSLLNVSATGTYWVHADDFCGNQFWDTITVLPFTERVDLGPDRIKCDNDTLHLEATAGFQQYTWGPAYTITTQADGKAVVQPLIDTIYFVAAQKGSGCVAYDTVRIKVNTSPPVSLGIDRSFCHGDSVTLNAGTGFVQHAWNTGGAAQQLVVYTAGNYSVLATAANGCHSSDTVNLALWAKPVVSLNDNPSLCAGTTKTLDAGNFAQYIWQDGSTSSSLVVSDTGTYSVQVRDAHQCTATDTVRITNLLHPPANFLPADTSICKYGTLKLQPIASYKDYAWSNLESSSYITVSTAGLYWLNVTDGDDCTGKDSITIHLKHDCRIGFYIPTAFTPDGNGRNDFYKPFIGGNVTEYQFAVYNRWGQAVFTTKDQFTGWDGKYAGVPQDANIFVWTCVYRLAGEPLKKENGTVMLIR